MAPSAERGSESSSVEQLTDWSERMTPWQNELGELVECVPDGALGFVYRVTHTETGRYYIGKCQAMTHAKLKPLKGKTRARRKWRETAWKKYTTSSRELNELIEADGIHEFEWRVLSWHKSKSGLGYEELRHQMAADVLRDPQSLNGIVNVRLSSVGE